MHTSSRIFGTDHRQPAAVIFLPTMQFLADRIYTARSMIGYWHDDVVCLSVCDAKRRILYSKSAWI